MSQRRPTFTLPEALIRVDWLLRQNKSHEAVRLCRAILDVAPSHVDALRLHGFACARVGAYADAAVSYRRILDLRPDSVEAHNNLGNALRELRRPEDAITCYRRALAISPQHASAHNNLGVALAMLGDYEGAVASYKTAVQLRGGYVAAYSNLGNALGRLRRHEEAIASYQKALEVEPDNGTFFTLIAAERRQLCVWTDFAQEQEGLGAWVTSGKKPAGPFVFLSFSDDPAKQLACAQRFARLSTGRVTRLPPVAAKDVQPRIRVAYLSADFHEHATAYLMAELFEKHDRHDFEIHGVSFGPNAQDAMRGRLVAAFDHFHDVRDKTDLEVAQLIRGLGVHIAVDLKGYTQDARPAILAYRPAPVQVNYLGYPGTMGADFMDYILVDRFVVPPDQQRFFSERLFFLPTCYQVNDGKREVAEAAPSREACGLPDSGFVFCCFNNNYKITPGIFDVWMRLLAKVPGSVFWLLKDNEGAERNLRHEAESRGVAADRLVFATRCGAPEHLARQKHADLFLDTFPYGAHTTASDALWAGVPVITYAGRAFASRVAGSLLTTIGLGDLVTYGLEDYEALASELARNRERLARYRRVIVENRPVSPLFDGARFARDLEAGFTAMVTGWRQGRSVDPSLLSGEPMR